MGHPSLASEFPNDNTGISAGAIWVADLTGPPKVQLAPYEPVRSEPFVLFFEEDDVYVDGPVELELHGTALSVAVQTPAPSEPEPEMAPAFAHFQQALVTALMCHGASRSAALVPLLLRLEALPAETLTKEVQLTLQSRGYLDGQSRYSAKYRELCSAWVAVLDGSSRDFSACGTTTLDRFGADLLAALLAIPATRADELRRNLRKAGIAAFGVLEAA